MLWWGENAEKTDYDFGQFLGGAVLNLGWLLSGNRSSPTFTSLTLVYQAIDAVCLRLFNALLTGFAPDSTLFSKDFQVCR